MRSRSCRIEFRQTWKSFVVEDENCLDHCDVVFDDGFKAQESFVKQGSAILSLRNQSKPGTREKF